MPLTAISRTASWSRARSRRPTLAARQSCQTTTSVPSPLCSVGRESTTRMSATIGNAYRRSLRRRTPVARAVARATPTRTMAKASPRAMAKAMAKAKVARAKVDEEVATASLTRTRTRARPEGTQILPQGGTLTHLVSNPTQDLRPVPRRKANKNKGPSVLTKMGTSPMSASAPASCAWRVNSERRGSK